MLRQRGQRVDADGQGAARLGARRLALLDLLEDVGELITEEDRDNGRRGLVGTEPVIIAAGGDDRPQHVGVQMHRADDRCAEHEKLHVGVRRLARLE